MLDILLTAFLIVFGFMVGLCLGFGNRKGLSGAIAPGIIGGLVFAIPSLREGEWISASIIVATALVGSIVSVFIADDNGFKRYVREHKNLHISIGSYRLGRMK